MFGLLRNLYKWYKSKNEKIVKFALIGIDNAGKTTILARIKGGMKLVHI
jgi:GTPase SAR1 family protein